MSYSMLDTSSRISCLRIGNLSIDRLSSRTFHGKGLRRMTRPSLLTTVNMKPRGRSLVRISVRSAGAVSTITTTSRFVSSFIRSLKSSICSRYAGSSGASAKTMTGRAIHLNASRSTSRASKIVSGASSQIDTAEGSVVLASVANALAGARDATRNVINIRDLRFVILSPFPLNICCNLENRRGFAPQSPEIATKLPKEVLS